MILKIDDVITSGDVIDEWALPHARNIGNIGRNIQELWSKIQLPDPTLEHYIVLFLIIQHLEPLQQLNSFGKRLGSCHGMTLPQTAGLYRT